MANGKQPELVIPLSSTAATPEPGNDRSEDSSNHEGSTGELGMATGSTRQESIDGLSTTNLLVRSPESKVAVDFELLWRLRKYLVLLGTLAVSVTYNAGLTPPGGFWTQKKDGHDAGDPILRARFFRRHEILRKWGFHEDQRSIPQIEDVEEARKFMLMLVTFSATIIYQAGLSPPGGFWAENEENQHPATSMLRSKNLARYNLFVSCNSTSFVASLVTIILLLSPELSRHGIRSRAVKVCVVADLVSLMGAYAAGSCRTVVQSFCVIFIAILVWIFIALLAGSFVIKPVADCLRNIKLSCMYRVGRVFSLEYGRNRSTNTVEENSVSSHQQTAVRVTDSAEQVSALEPEHQSYRQQVPNVKEGEHQSAYYQQVPKVKKGEPPREHQSTGEQEQTSTTEEVVSGTGHTLANDQQSENGRPICR